MLLGLYIVRDDEFEDPLYADPAPRELDEELWEALCEVSNDAQEGTEVHEGVRAVGEAWIGWRFHEPSGLSFLAAVSDEVRSSQVSAVLARLARRYLDEADDPREPDRHGVVDVVIDVVPPWDEE